MTNDERTIRATPTAAEGSSNDNASKGRAPSLLSFRFRHSFVIRYSSFVIFPVAARVL